MDNFKKEKGYFMGRKYLQTVFILLIIIMKYPLMCYAEENESFYKQLSKAIFQLEHYEKIKIEGMDRTNERFVPEGTGFFVRYEDSLYIVSARHVVDKPFDLYAKINCRNINTKEHDIALVKLSKNKWIFHPEEGNENTRPVDVAVMKIYPVKDRDIIHFSHFSSPSKTVDQFAGKDPEPPKEILVFGFPINLGFELKEEKNPMGRKGIASMVMEKPFIMSKGKYFDKKTVLVDVDAFPGNSGSPAISISTFGGKIKLEGLLIATNIGGRYAVIEPISRIKEVLEVAKDEENETARVWVIENIGGENNNNE